MESFGSFPWHFCQRSEFNTIIDGEGVIDYSSGGILFHLVQAVITAQIAISFKIVACSSHVR